MKFRRLITLLVLFACLSVSAPAFALLAIPDFTIPFDPIPIIPPPLLDPCFGAEVKADMGDLHVYNPMSGTGYFTGIYTYDVSISGTPVAHVITNYKRVDFGSSSQVSMEDTFIDIDHDMTVFGRSVNRNTTGIIGVEGIIVGAVRFNGNPVNIKGTYITTGFGGSNHFCAFLQ